MVSTKDSETYNYIVYGKENEAKRIPWMRLTDEEIEEKKEKRKIARDKARARAFETITHF